MQIAVIKHLAETFSLEVLQKAEAAICEEQMLEIAIEGKDEGEKLTHVLAAINILEDVKANDVDIRTAIRNYSQRVRNSIS